MCNRYHIKGSKIQDGSWHDKDHLKWSRRSFLSKTTLFTGASLFLSQIPLTAFAQSHLNLGVNSDNILVLIQLKGGNDGLNTIIPFYDFGKYQSLRPKIYINKNEAITLNKDFGMHPAMRPLESLWKKGMMKIINNVGYPDPNMSHFRSMDIWTSGSAAQEMESTGWLGRYLEDMKLGSDRPVAIAVGEDTSLVFQGVRGQLAMNIENPKDLYEVAKTGQSFKKIDVQSQYDEELDFLNEVCNATKKYAESIYQADIKGKVQAAYRDGDFSQQLKQVAKLIKGNLGTRVYMVTLDGFDTHASQEWKHENLLKELSNGIAAFYDDLSAAKLQNKVLTMTFSEFGRRIKENGSRGTDHGTAAPVMMFGGGLGDRKILGDAPNLNHLDEDGNLIFSTDFRSVYATVLQNWMGANPNTCNQVLKGQFKTLHHLF